MKPLILLLLSLPLSATTYFVSTSGSNANNGTSALTPWQTISKVSSPVTVTYVPGDVIQFKCGDIWQGSPNFSSSLTTPVAGTSVNQITYTSYGTCTGSNKPILDGNSSIGTLINITRNWITINGLSLQNANPGSTTGQLISSNSPGLSVLNVTMKNAGFRGVSVNVGSKVGPIVMDGNTFTMDVGHTIGNSVFIIQTTPTANTSPITFTHNTCDLRPNLNSSALCLNIQGSSVTTIQYNTAYNTSQAWAIKPAGGAACTGTQAVTGGLIADNYAENIQGGNGDGEGIELQGCNTNGHNFPQSGVTVTRNVVICGHDPSTGSLDAIGLFVAQGDFIFDNVLIGPCGPGPLTSTPRVIHASSSSFNNIYYNNVISGGTGATGHRGIIFDSASNSDLVKNNIFDRLAVGIDNNAAPSPVEDGNIFNSTNVTTNTTGNFTHGTNTSQTTNPQFATIPLTAANDSKLQSVSPAISTGINLGSTYAQILDPVSTSVPYATVSQSSGWMIGAFGPTTPPTTGGIIIHGAKLHGGIIP